jgi:hypothetical protein
MDEATFKHIFTMKPFVNPFFKKNISRQLCNIVQSINSYKKLSAISHFRGRHYNPDSVPRDRGTSPYPVNLEGSKIETLLTFFCKMEFQEVTKLVLGNKYKVVHHLHEYTATYKRSFHYNPTILTFSTKEKEYHHYLFPGDKAYKYYEPILGRIQSEMEERALRLIFRKLLGDPHFDW